MSLFAGACFTFDKDSGFGSGHSPNLSKTPRRSGLTLRCLQIRSGLLHCPGRLQELVDIKVRSNSSFVASFTPNTRNSLHAGRGQSCPEGGIAAQFFEDAEVLLRVSEAGVPAHQGCATRKSLGETPTWRRNKFRKCFGSAYPTRTPISNTLISELRSNSFARAIRR